MLHLLYTNTLKNGKNKKIYARKELADIYYDRIMNEHN
jgi:hypothetical protein